MPAWLSKPPSARDQNARIKAEYSIESRPGITTPEAICAARGMIGDASRIIYPSKAIVLLSENSCSMVIEMPLLCLCLYVVKLRYGANLDSVKNLF
jgi:hypothetical protein